MYKRYIKRLLDLIFGLIFFVIFSPLMLIIAITNFIFMGLPLHNVIRERYGKNKKIYIMYKFRTKKLNKEYVTDGSQYTKYSKFIDRTSLNELPQLINIIKGDMSFVGPRPLIPSDDGSDLYSKMYEVRPGLTGLAQIHGMRSISVKKREYYDNYYVDHVSFLLDMKIILQTPIAIIRQLFNRNKK